MSLDINLVDPTAIYEGHTLFDCNITHNLTEMADKAGMYKHLWRPEELGIKTAHELIEPLKSGLMKLLNDPKHFKKFNPENGWGCYAGLINFVEDYLKACKKYPKAIIKTYR